VPPSITELCKKKTLNSTSMSKRREKDIEMMMKPGKHKEK